MAISRASSSFAAAAASLASASALAFTSAAALSTFAISWPHDASVATIMTVANIDAILASFITPPVIETQCPAAGERNVGPREAINTSLCYEAKSA